MWISCFGFNFFFISFVLFQCGFYFLEINSILEKSFVSLPPTMNNASELYILFQLYAFQWELHWIRVCFIIEISRVETTNSRMAFQQHQPINRCMPPLTNTMNSAFHFQNPNFSFYFNSFHLIECFAFVSTEFCRRQKSICGKQWIMSYLWDFNNIYFSNWVLWQKNW